MPSFGIEALLLAFAVLVAWSSTIAGYPGSGDVCSTVLFLLLYSDLMTLDQTRILEAPDHSDTLSRYVRPMRWPWIVAGLSTC
jgi:hypothetical protein